MFIMPKKIAFILLSATSLLASQNASTQKIPKQIEINHILDLLPTPHPLIILDQKKPVKIIKWSPDSRYLATLSADNFLRIWNADTGAVIEQVGSPELIKDFMWSPDGRRLVIDDGSNMTRIVKLEPAFIRETQVSRLSDEQRNFVVEIVTGSKNRQQLFKEHHALFKTLPYGIQEDIMLVIHSDAPYPKR